MNSTRKVLACLCAVICLSTVAYAEVSTCRLRVNDEAKVKGPWPLVGGLPFPRAAVTDAAHIRIVDAQGREIPAQVDVAATYKDGSIRWALASFMGSTDGDYRADFGPAVRRGPAKGIAVTEKDGQVLVDTGAARFTVTKDNLLVNGAVLTGERTQPLWAAGEQQAYLIDNQGRRAVCAGQGAEIELRTLKAGPLRCALRTEGWYVTDQGERVARGIARMTFFAGSAMVEVSHTLVFTEDTNRLWVRDYGIETRLRASGVAKATFDVAKQFDTTVQSVALKPGESARMMQDDFPHFAERNSHFSLSLASNGQARELATGEACGEWCDLSSDGVGLTVVVRDLAEQFPKELEVAPDGIRVHLWPARSGKELDFRAATLVKDYWAGWSNRAPGGADALAKVGSNAQAAGKTHEIMLMPHAGPLDAAMAASRAHAVCKPVLLLP
ncbi:MAG: hypothetical protein FJ278_19840, partial [Planctomycetes bacterium]|nr:hypothetical protein [Planctomycetota bacterium]